MNLQNKRLLKAIRDGDNLVIRQLYTDCFQYTTKFVQTNNGTLDDAMECFQEALIVLFRGACKEEFVLKTDVKYFLAGVVKNIWLKELERRKKSKKILTSPDLQRNNLQETEDFDQILLEKIKLDENYDKLSIALNEIGDNCRQLLSYTFFEKKKDKEIAVLMDYALEFVRQKRKRCLNKLKKITNEL